MSGTASGVRPEQRFSASNPCPICGGHGNKPRGIGERCSGFRSDGGAYARCSREEHAGQAPYEEKTRAYIHKLTGDCKCGASHGLLAGERNGSGQHHGGERPRIVATYDYTDEQGQLLFQVVRQEPKSFPQRQPNPEGRGGWTWSVRGVRRVPYKLPKLLAADTMETVFIFEGEEDVHKAEEDGLLATTNPEGAGKWSEECTSAVHGHPVVIIPDEDPKGERHAEHVARAVYGKAASVKVVRLPRLEWREKSGEDYRDWREKHGGTLEELRQLVKDAPEWTPPEERDEGRVMLGVVLRDGVEPPAVLVDDALLYGKTHAIYGPSGHGKTYMLLWLALEVLKRGLPVIVFDNENNVSIMAERLEQLGADPDQLDRLFHYYPFPDLPTTEEGRQVFEARLERIKPGLVCFDSWISFLASNGLDENSSNDIAEFSAHYLRPARRRGVTTLILDHVPHEGNHARGSTRKRDEVDVMWKLSRTQPFDRDRVGSISLNRVKDREGWLSPSVTFSIGGTGDGGFVFSRSSGTIEQEDEEGLKDSERQSLIALDTFGGTGAKVAEWQRKAKTFEVSRTSFYRAMPELERKGWVFQENRRYFIKRSQKVPNQSHGTNGTKGEAGSKSSDRVVI